MQSPVGDGIRHRVHVETEELYWGSVRYTSWNWSDGLAQTKYWPFPVPDDHDVGHWSVHEHANYQTMLHVVSMT